MIDVLLVLLIIFMMAIPMMRKAIDVQLPDPTPAIAPANAQLEPDRARGAADGSYMINSEKVDQGPTSRSGSRRSTIRAPTRSSS